MLKGKTNWKQSVYTKALLYGMGVSLLFFLPFILFDNGYFLFYGDFNVQQVPFYQMCHDAIRNGSWGWNWTTDLGANFIGSYTFYLLGSPFFWLTIPFPSEFVPHLMGPLLILKFGCASLTGCLYLRRYVRRDSLAILGGMLYAFSGFSVYNIFFNHFHEAIVFFPLMLWALDEYMATRRRGVFALTVFASCFVNYYFFVGQVVFCLIYFFVRLLCKNWEISLRDFLLLFCESVIGVLCTSILLVPTILSVVQNPRVSNPPEGWGALLYGWNQRYLHIIECFFFPPDIPARPNFTPDSEAKWASLGAWLPLFSMTGVIAFLQCEDRRHWLKKLLPLLFLMAMIPVLNSAFQLFNSSYYARWFYMLTLMTALATVLVLRKRRTNWKRAILWTLSITLFISISVGLMPKVVDKNGVKSTVYGLEAYPTRFWGYVAIALISLLLLTIILHYRRRNHKKFMRLCILGVSGITVLYSLYFIALGKTQSNDTHKEIIPYALNGGADIKLPDEDQFSRIDVLNGMDNLPMYWQRPTIQAFHSIVPGSVMEFYPSIGVARDVGSRPETSVYGLRGLTSCRWLFDPTSNSQDFKDKQSGKTKMPGWSYYGNQNGSDIWQNDYYIPMGFCYDSFVTEAEYEAVTKSDRHLLLLKAMVLDNEQSAKYAGILTHFDEVKSTYYSEEGYLADCEARRATACSDFQIDNGGFTASIQTDKENLVFFSVPYEDGWSAQVNGEPAEVEKVNVGFMAVRVPAGESVIRFSYQTPGLKLGAAATLGGALLLLLYLFLTGSLKRRPRPEPAVSDTVILHAGSSPENSLPNAAQDAENAVPIEEPDFL